MSGNGLEECAGCGRKITYREMESHVCDKSTLRRRERDERREAAAASSNRAELQDADRSYDDRLADGFNATRGDA